jgi:TRAP-type mannitol/chloroaromatic compound transport system substrate-binding protein
VKASSKTDVESELHKGTYEDTMPNVYKAGDRVPATGLYKVVHAGQHAEPHHVMAACGGKFPTCVECSDSVRFELEVSAVYVNAHPQFSR